LARPEDKEKREGAFYVWTKRELVDILGERDAQIASRYWGVDENGNVAPEHDVHDELMNQNVLSVKADLDTLAKDFSMPREQVVNTLEAAREKLYAYREKERPRPALDDKIVLAWNGLAIGALARTSAALEGLDPEKYAKQIKTYRNSAEQTVAFIKQSMRDDKTGHLKRVWREGPGDAPAFADDYAFLISGLVDLYEATWDDSYLGWADQLQRKSIVRKTFSSMISKQFSLETQIELFWDGAHGGFFATADGQSDLILRLKDGMDNAEPSTNGFCARNLYRLASIFGDDKYASYARRTLHAFEAEIMQHPHLFATMLDCVVAEALGVKGIVITGTGNAVDKEIKMTRARTAACRTVVRLGGGARDEWIRERSELLKAVNPEKPGVQICEGGVCKEVLDLHEEK
jgi:uncharacterized protein YyaL (SSP411 family)